MMTRKLKINRLLGFLLCLSIISQLYLNKQKLDLNHQFVYQLYKEEVYKNDDYTKSRDIAIIKGIIIKAGELIWMRFKS